MQTVWVLPAFTIGLISGCASQPAVDLAAEREALRESAEAYELAAQTGDLEAFASSYAPGGTMMPPNEEAISGATAIREYFSAFNSLDDFSLESELQTVELSPDGQMGYTVGRITLSWREGDMEMGETARDVHIWTRNADGAWKIALDVWNSLLPLGEMD